MNQRIVVVEFETLERHAPAMILPVSSHLEGRLATVRDIRIVEGIG